MAALSPFMPLEGTEMLPITLHIAEKSLLTPKGAHTHTFLKHKVPHPVQHYLHLPKYNTETG